jgi:hypothetical protein
VPGLQDKGCFGAGKVGGFRFSCARRGAEKRALRFLAAGHGGEMAEGFFGVVLDESGRHADAETMEAAGVDMEFRLALRRWRALRIKLPLTDPRATIGQMEI